MQTMLKILKVPKMLTLLSITENADSTKIATMPPNAELSDNTGNADNIIDAEIKPILTLLEMLKTLAIPILLSIADSTAEISDNHIYSEIAEILPCWQC